MRTPAVLAGLCLLASYPLLFAQDTEHHWSKSYPVTGEPNLTLETSDANLRIHSCGDCHQVQIEIQLDGRKLSEYRLEESQTGDSIHFSLKEKLRVGVHIDWHHSATEVTVETPARVKLDAHTSDGPVEIEGLRDELALRSGDGDVEIRDVKGSLRLQSGDGHVRVTDAEGSIEARSSDGSLTVDGLFHALALHTSDARLDLTLRAGSKLTEASSIQTSDGAVEIRLPRDFAADMDVHTSDGHVNCSLPLTMDHYQSGGYQRNGGSSHGLDGKLNGGGETLSIRTSDGNVTIEPL